MNVIPKSLVRVNTSFAVQPTEEQLLNFFKDYGHNSLEETLDAFGGWEEVIREWFVNTYYGIKLDECQEKNILRFDDDTQEDEVILIDDEEWEKHVHDGYIF